jgi:hypothetical protein
MKSMGVRQFFINCSSETMEPFEQRSYRERELAFGHQRLPLLLHDSRVVVEFREPPREVLWQRLQLVPLPHRTKRAGDSLNSAPPCPALFLG